MYKSIDEFLLVLKQELKGNDKAMIQDVLSDAEEHIRTALENSANTEQGITEEEALKELQKDLDLDDYHFIIKFGRKREDTKNPDN